MLSRGAQLLEQRLRWRRLSKSGAPTSRLCCDPSPLRVHHHFAIFVCWTPSYLSRFSFRVTCTCPRPPPRARPGGPCPANARSSVGGRGPPRRRWFGRHFSAASSITHTHWAKTSNLSDSVSSPGTLKWGRVSPGLRVRSMRCDSAAPHRVRPALCQEGTFLEHGPGVMQI